MVSAIHAETGALALRYDDAEGEAYRDGCERRVVHTKGLMTAVLDFNDGPWDEPDPYHSHPHEQITYVAAGELLFLCDGEEPVRLVGGDAIAIPSGVPHTVQLISEHVRLVDSFQPLRDDFL